MTDASELVERLRFIAEMIAKLPDYVWGRVLKSYIPRMGSHRVEAIIDAEYEPRRDIFVRDIRKAMSTIEHLTERIAELEDGLAFLREQIVMGSRTTSMLLQSIDDTMSRNEHR